MDPLNFFSLARRQGNESSETGDSNRAAHFPSMLQGKENEFDFMFFTARFGGQMHGFKAQKRHETAKAKT